jgi:hypothetical protein
MIQIGNDYENEVSNLTVREAVSSKPDATSTEVRVFLATKGLTGIAPSSIKSGDEIYTFRGSNIALILGGKPFFHRKSWYWKGIFDNASPIRRY